VQLPETPPPPKFPIGGIIGIAVGGSALVILTVVIIVLVIKKKKKKATGADVNRPMIASA
jgi:hypothetical protein